MLEPLPEGLEALLRLEPRPVEPPVDDCLTRARTGWNTAKASSVEAATATPALDEAGEGRLQREHGDDEQCQDRRRRQAQPSVRLTSRSISYRR